MELGDVLSEGGVAYHHMIAPGDELLEFLRELEKDCIIDIEDESGSKFSEPAIEPETLIVEATTFEVDRIGPKQSCLGILIQTICTFDLVAKSPAQSGEVVVNGGETWPVLASVSAVAEHLSKGVEAKASGGDICS